MRGYPYYPDDITGPQICIIEGHTGDGHCPRCGDRNYALLGYYGAIARWAKAWGVTKEEAQRRIDYRMLVKVLKEIKKEEALHDNAHHS